MGKDIDQIVDRELALIFFRKVAIAALIILASAFLYWWCAVPEPPSREESKRETAQEEANFKRLLKKHGLHKQVAVVRGWPDRPYFIRGGQRCSFR